MWRHQRRARLFSLLGVTAMSRWANAQEALPPADAGAPAPVQPAPSPQPAQPQAQPGYGYPPAYPPGSYPPGQYAPAAYPPGQYPPPPYAPPAYPPGYAPPPGYPPAGYAYPYYAPPPDVPPKPRYPDDAAARTSPFVDLIMGGTVWGDRFSSFFNVGLELGVFIAGKVRVGARAQIFPAEPDDTGSFNEERPNFINQPSDPATVLYGGSLGYALASSPNFVLSPGVIFMRTDVAAYGNFLGLAVPFEWVNDSSVRIGFEVALGRAFGGDVRATCQGPFNSSGLQTDCVVAGVSTEDGGVRDFNRSASVGMYAHFEVGLGFNRPKPLNR